MFSPPPDIVLTCGRGAGQTRTSFERRALGINVVATWGPGVDVLEVVLGSEGAGETQLPVCYRRLLDLNVLCAALGKAQPKDWTRRQRDEVVVLTVRQQRGARKRSLVTPQGALDFLQMVSSADMFAPPNADDAAPEYSVSCAEAGVRFSALHATMRWALDALKERERAKERCVQRARRQALVHARLVHAVAVAPAPPSHSAPRLACREDARLRRRPDLRSATPATGVEVPVLSIAEASRAADLAAFERQGAVLRELHAAYAAECNKQPEGQRVMSELQFWELVKGTPDFRHFYECVEACFGKQGGGTKALRNMRIAQLFVEVSGRARGQKYDAGHTSRGMFLHMRGLSRPGIEFLNAVFVCASYDTIKGALKDLVSEEQYLVVERMQET